MREIGEAEAVVVDGVVGAEAGAEVEKAARNGVHRFVNTTHREGKSISGHEHRR
jgi:hypothetical protein